MNDFRSCFHTKSADAVDLAKRYITGLLTQVPRKNMERIDKRADAPEAPGADSHQHLQQFISDRPWDEDLLPGDHGSGQRAAGRASRHSAHNR